MDISITGFLIYLLFLGLFTFLLFCICLKIFTKPYPNIWRSNNEKYFKKSTNRDAVLCPSLDDPSAIHLSVIVPAYNEEERLPRMLDECIDYLDRRSLSSNFRYEIIIVSDGSKDGTVKVGAKYIKETDDDRVRVLELETNRGKGGAVRLGMMSARGAVLLFADADGATKFSDLSKLESCLNDLTKCDYINDPKEAEKKLAISIGSRAHLEDDAIATRNYFRTILMHGFHFLVWFFAVRGIRDTQCGFKLLTRQAARLCFESMHVERWAFDVELLYIAQRLHIPISEIAVNWTEIEGSKITPVWSWVQMGKDLGLIWLRYKIGAWKLASDKNK